MHKLQPLIKLLLISLAASGTSGQMYQWDGYSLEQQGDLGSIVYNTSSTPANVPALPDPDVLLNAEVEVGTVNLEVDDLSTKINLEAQVLSLFKFSAGLKSHVDRVQIALQNVTAFAHLEGRLDNLFTMIGDALDSIDMNPAVADIGGNPHKKPPGPTMSGRVPINVVTRALSPLDDYMSMNNLLYSMNNDYDEDTQTNRILTHHGEILDQVLDLDGNLLGQHYVGHYTATMAPIGHDQTITFNDIAYREIQYEYTPMPGVNVVAAIYKDDSDTVIAARVLAENEVLAQSFND